MSDNPTMDLGLDYPEIREWQKSVRNIPANTGASWKMMRVIRLTSSGN